MAGPAISEYQSAFEYAPNPIGVIRDGILVDCNLAMVEMFGLKDKAEVIGRRAGETFSPESQSDGELSTTKAGALLERCVEFGQTTFTWTSKRINGDLLSTQVMLRVLDDSEPPHIVCYIHDISGLKASQQAALSRKAYLGELLESSPVAFMVSDLSTGRVCKVNRAGRAMLGLPEHASAMMRADELLARPSDRVRFLRRLRKHGVASGEILLKRPDGGLLYSEVSWRYNPGNDNEVLCWGVDITEFKRTQRELEHSRDRALKADNAKSEFLSRMSHELRTPLNAILGFGQLLQLDRDNLNPEQNDAVRHILSAGERLLELIKDTLDFSRVNSRHVSFRYRRMPTLESLNASIALIRPLAHEAGVSVATRPGPLPDILADAHWLQQVLVNLLSNAIKYNHRGGTVTVSSESCSEGNLRIHVRDSGEGIDPGDAHRLFKPFERISASRRPDIEGTGIGLALCKEIIELMSGRIGFESEPGAGSDFWIELPAFKERCSAECAPKPFKILYIEDQLTSIGPMLETAKRIAGCELMTATDATTGLALANSARPDLIVMDVELTRAGATGLVKQLQGEEFASSRPVYGLISNPEYRHSVDGRLAAFTHLIPSPPQPEFLVRLIKAATP